MPNQYTGPVKKGGGMDKIEWYIFILSAMLIAVVYYSGVKTDAAAFSNLFNSGIATVTGRNPTTGVFQNVGGQPAPATTP